MHNRYGTPFWYSVYWAMHEHPQGWQLGMYTPKQYQGMRLWITPDGRCGAAVTSDRELVSVHRHPESRESMSTILREACEEATWLTCFDVDGFLPRLYSDYGYREIERYAFDPALAPKLWTPDKGRPDVVKMERWGLGGPE